MAISTHSMRWFNVESYLNKYDVTNGRLFALIPKYQREEFVYLPADAVSSTSNVL